MNVEELEAPIRKLVEKYNENIMDILVKLNENGDLLEELTIKANDQERQRRRRSEGGKKARANQTAEQRKAQAIKANSARGKNASGI